MFAQARLFLTPSSTVELKKKWLNNSTKSESDISRWKYCGSSMAYCNDLLDCCHPSSFCSVDSTYICQKTISGLQKKYRRKANIRDYTYYPATSCWPFRDHSKTTLFILPYKVSLSYWESKKLRWLTWFCRGQTIPGSNVLIWTLFSVVFC